MRDLNGKVVALTGAASGIGRALALALAREGCQLSLADMDIEGLEQTRRDILDQALAQPPVITLSKLDVAQQGQVEEWAALVVDSHGHVDILINNAGVAALGSLEEMTLEEFNWVFDIVFYGVLYGCKAFLPFLKQRPRANIVNISSVNGFFPFPNNSPYNCAKHAVKALSQSMMQELSGTGVKVSSVHPGGIQTNIVNSSRRVGQSRSEADHSRARKAFNKAAMTSPEKAAAIIIKGIKQDKQRVLVGRDAYVLDLLCRLFPQAFSNYVGRRMGNA